MISGNSKGLAVKIQHRLGAQIRRACAGSLVPEDFLAGLIAAENPLLHPDVARFDKAVFFKLRQLRSPWRFWFRNWNGISQAMLKGKPDAALINFATSWGLTQVKGWRFFFLDCSVGELLSPQTHLCYAVSLLERIAARQLYAGHYDDYDAVLRIWNTGSANDAPRDPAYLAQALSVRSAYVHLLRADARTSRAVPPRTNDAPAPTPQPTVASASP